MSLGLGVDYFTKEMVGMTCKVAEIVPAEIVNKAYEAFSNLFGNKLTKQPGKSKLEQIRAIEIEQINAKKIQARRIKTRGGTIANNRKHRHK